MDRIVAFSGATNFRDLGGYETTTGAVVRSGRVFRSDSLHTLTAADLMRFDGLGIRVIYDLRGLEERNGFPGPRPDVHLELWTAGVSEAAGLRTSEDGERWLSNGYAAMIDRGRAGARPPFGHLANDHELPAVFHCFGGKDRTGFAAAVLLSALGVEQDVVLDDYELTDELRGGRTASRDCSGVRRSGDRRTRSGGDVVDLPVGDGRNADADRHGLRRRGPLPP